MAPPGEEPRTYSDRPESAGWNMPAATDIARARISVQMEPRLPVDETRDAVRARFHLNENRSNTSRQRVVHCAAQAVDDLVDLACGDDEGRCQQDVVAARAVDRAAHWIDHQPAGHRRLLDPGVQLTGGIERRLGHPVLDQLDRLEQAAAADVADMGMVAEALAQPPAEMRAH